MPHSGIFLSQRYSLMYVGTYPLIPSNIKERGQINEKKQIQDDT